MKKKIVVFASGNGSNFINIYKNIKSQNIIADLCLLISNNPKCGAVDFAVKNKIDVFIYNSHRFIKDKNQNILLEKLNNYKPDLILLAGYMKKISNLIINKYRYKILNIHPSLLPLYGGKGFYGMKVHNQVYKNKDKITGATVHFIDKNYDTGPILIQEKINLEYEETPENIAKKVLCIEHKIYYKAVKLFCANKIEWNNNKPLIKG